MITPAPENAIESDALIHILVVEDDAAHAELIRRVFSSPSASRFQLSVVATVEEARSLLRTDPVQLIIADWLLPDDKGTDLLDQHVAGEKVPVIIITSHGNEELAVEVMKAGALDYVVKPRATFEDLVHITELAVHEQDLSTRHENAVRALRESENKFRELFDNAGDAIFLYDISPGEKSGQFLEVNVPACRMLQYSYDELHAKTISDITPVEFRDRDDAIIHKIRTKGQEKFEGYLVSRVRTQVPVEISAHVFELEGRNVVLSIARDIRDRKEMISRQKEALIQIERNIHQLALLNDQIRNPLSVIVAIADSIEETAGDKILFHALEITKIISLLDKDWMESAKIHNFLTKHYHLNAGYDIERYNNPITMNRGEPGS